MQGHTPEDEAFRQQLMDALGEDALCAPEREESPPPAKFELKNISHVHEAIMNVMISYPQWSLREVAAHFGYTQAWLSTLIHSDIFQARLREKQTEVFSAVKEDLSTKLGALADVSLEGLQRKVENSEDPKFLLEASKLALNALGFGGQKAGGNSGTINNNTNVQQVFVASPADLEAARERMRQAGLGLPCPAPTQVLATPDNTALVGQGVPALDSSTTIEVGNAPSSEIQP